MWGGTLALCNFAFVTGIWFYIVYSQHRFMESVRSYVISAEETQVTSIQLGDNRRSNIN